MVVIQFSYLIMVGNFARNNLITFLVKKVFITSASHPTLEMCNFSIVEMARCMLEKKIPYGSWVESMHTIVYFLNNIFKS